jgi:hypothetical protein
MPYHIHYRDDRMNRRMSETAAALLLLVVACTAVHAQSTALPTFHAPTRAFGNSETGVALSRPGGDVNAFELRLGVALDEADLQFRGGYVDLSGDGGNWVAGAEGRIPVLGRTSGFPLDGALILGIGRIFADGGGQTIVPLGLSLGRRLFLDGNALVLTPYVQPTVIFIDDEIFAFGLGIDLKIGDVPEIRFNWAEGDMDGFSVSLFWSR